MIIVSQNKISTTNFDNATTIEVNKLNNKEYNIKAYLTNGREICLAIYETEERAKEVLREIVDTFGIREIRNSTYQYADLAIKSRKYSIYEMPES